MPWLEIQDYGVNGWSDGVDASARARHYCAELERGGILFFSRPPFALPEEHCKFLLALRPAGSRLHKNVSYRPETDVLRGFDDGESRARVHEILRGYATEVCEFVAGFLWPYAQKFLMDYASFRPLEEEGRDLPLHKRNDLLHVDAFPSRPTRGGRILRIFTNVNPEKPRVWTVGERFPQLAARYAQNAGLMRFAGEPTSARAFKKGLSRLGVVPDRAPYDRFMLHFHDWLKENADFQDTPQGKERMEFPPMATWLVFTDGVPHAALSGQFAMEQTFIIPVDALVEPGVSPLQVLERLSGRAMG